MTDESRPLGLDYNPGMALTFSGGTLLLTAPHRTDGKKPWGMAAWEWDARVAAWRCNAIHYSAIVAQVAAGRGRVIDQVPQWETVRWPQVDLHELRPDQQAALDAWRAAQRGMIVMPTGTGKTEVALAIIRDVAVATLVVAPVRDLMYQWHRRILCGLGYDAGIIGDSIFRVQSVSVTTYDSACIHMERLGARFGLIIFDECHHLPSNVRRDAARMCVAPQRLGLTATPERTDGRHVDLEELIGPIVYQQSIVAARGKTLAEYEVVRIPVHLSDEEQRHYNELSSLVRRFMTERRTTEPKYSWRNLCAETGQDPAARRALQAYRQKQTIEDRAEEKLRVLEDLFRLHADGPVIIFAGSNAMARDVSRRFLIPCLLSHCRKHERREILEGLQNGTYPALVANQILDEGVDLPEAKVAVVIGGLASTKQAQQRLGRILRKSGNSRAVLYEVVCTDTNEAQRSRQRRGSEAYAQTRHRRV